MKTIISQAETFRRALKFTNVKSGEIVNLTGCTAYSQMRVKPKGTWHSDATCAIDTNNGIITATWSKEQTAQFPLGVLGYDIWLTCDGEQKPIFSEQVEIVEGYTEIGA